MADLIHISQLYQFVSQQPHGPAFSAAFCLATCQCHQMRFQVSIHFSLRLPVPAAGAAPGHRAAPRPQSVCALVPLWLSPPRAHRQSAHLSNLALSSLDLLSIKFSRASGYELLPSLPSVCFRASDVALTLTGRYTFSWSLL